MLYIVMAKEAAAVAAVAAIAVVAIALTAPEATEAIMEAQPAARAEIVVLLVDQEDIKLLV